ncbi:unnamed protein product [Closterium sp. NIES-65]|nr:unnamed protein product [Closterium sp. NIES-65]
MMNFPGAADDNHALDESMDTMESLMLNPPDQHPTPGMPSGMAGDYSSILSSSSSQFYTSDPLGQSWNPPPLPTDSSPVTSASFGGFPDVGLDPAPPPYHEALQAPRVGDVSSSDIFSGLGLSASGGLGGSDFGLGMPAGGADIHGGIPGGVFPGGIGGFPGGSGGPEAASAAANAASLGGAAVGTVPGQVTGENGGSGGGASGGKGQVMPNDFIDVRVVGSKKLQEAGGSMIPGGGSYVAYVIETKTNVPEYGAPSARVERRFREFVALADRYTEHGGEESQVLQGAEESQPPSGPIFPSRPSPPYRSLGETHRGYSIPERPDKSVVESQVLCSRGRTQIFLPVPPGVLSSLSSRSSFSSLDQIGRDPPRVLHAGAAGQERDGESGGAGGGDEMTQHPPSVPPVLSCNFISFFSRLAETHRGYFIPVRPDKNVMESQVLQGAEFVKTRQVELDKYVQRLARHPAIRRSADLISFLTSSERFQPASSVDIASRVLEGAVKLPQQLFGAADSITPAEAAKPAGGGRNLLRMFKEFGQSVANDWTGKPPAVSGSTSAAGGGGGTSTSALEAGAGAGAGATGEESGNSSGKGQTAPTAAEVEADEARFGSARAKLADLDKHLAEATAGAVQMMQAQDGCSRIVGSLGITFGAQLSHSVVERNKRTLSILLEYHKTTAAARTALADRSQALLTWQTLESDLGGKKTKLDRLGSVDGSDPAKQKKAQELQREIQALEKAKEAAINEYRKITERNASELQRFESERKQEFLAMLGNFVQDQVLCAQKMAAIWAPVGEDRPSQS